MIRARRAGRLARMPFFLLHHQHEPARVRGGVRGLDGLREPAPARARRRHVPHRRARRLVARPGRERRRRARAAAALRRPADGPDRGARGRDPVEGRGRARRISPAQTLCRDQLASRRSRRRTSGKSSCGRGDSMPEATAISPPTSNGNGADEVTFPELVRAHHLWETSADAATGEARLARFKQLLDDFQYRVRPGDRRVLVPQGGLGRRAHPARDRRSAGASAASARSSTGCTASPTGSPARTTRSPTCCTTRTSSASRPPRASRACRARS